MLEKTFDNLTANQLKKLKIKTNIQRSDSTLISSNIRGYIRIQLLIEVLLRLTRIFDNEDRDILSSSIKPYSTSGSDKYVYKLKSSDLIHELEKLGKLYNTVYEHIKVKYSNTDEFRVFERAFKEHFTIIENQAKAKTNKELNSNMLQSPDDEDATYRKKQDQESKGFTLNATETANPENDIQLITDIAVNQNNIDELHTDGGYASNPYYSPTYKL